MKKHGLIKHMKSIQLTDGQSAQMLEGVTEEQEFVTALQVSLELHVKNVSAGTSSFISTKVTFTYF